MLDERKAAILRAVVQEYIQTAQPVGSQHVARSGEVHASSATIRNEMAVLEREGYLTQPHTSAGRIPTDKGYRFFVDHLPDWGTGRLSPAQATQVREFFTKAHGELEHLLGETSHLLSRLTAHTAVVLGPPAEQASVRSAQIVALGGRTALVVIVLSNGVVAKHAVELPLNELGEPVGDGVVGAASATLAKLLVGHGYGSKVSRPSTGDATVDALVEAALSSIAEEHATEPEPLYVGGASHLAAGFDAVGTVQRILGLLEQQFVVVTLLRDLLDRGLSVAIGAGEHGLDPLAECAVIVAPVQADGEQAGTIGVLGPMRMNYPQALAAVAMVSHRLGRVLADT